MRVTLLLPAIVGILAQAQTPISYPYAISSVAGGYQLGNGGPAKSAYLEVPQSVAIDKAGNILIADGAGHGTRKITADGNINTFSPVGAADLKLDAAGNVYVVDGVSQAGKISVSGNLILLAGGATSALSGVATSVA